MKMWVEYGPKHLEMIFLKLEKNNQYFFGKLQCCLCLYHLSKTRWTLHYTFPSSQALISSESSFFADTWLARLGHPLTKRGN